MKSKEQILKELEPKRPNFKVDVFEELILQDIARYDEETQIKLNRDLTQYFNNWLNDKPEAKEQVKIVVKGQTRSGKSLIALKLIKKLTDKYPDKTFSIEKTVCANQKELRQKLQNAQFGDSFLVDENLFANVGMGSFTETQQLKDLNNIIAKQNNHMIYITPERFLDVGATMGLAYFGKDNKQWLSRFLLYAMKSGFPTLLGYVVIDVGSLFRESGCLIYKLTGGCTNPNKLNIDDLSIEHITYSDCIPKVNGCFIDNDKLIDTRQQCPFYEVCTSELCKYEHKKDKWIDREMKGGLTERERERYELAIDIFKDMSYYNEEGLLKLKGKNAKQIREKIILKLPKFTNAKLTGTETDQINNLIIMMAEDLSFLQDLCNNIEINYEDLMEEIGKEE